MRARRFSGLGALMGIFAFSSVVMADGIVQPDANALSESELPPISIGGGWTVPNWGITLPDLSGFLNLGPVPNLINPVDPVAPIVPLDQSDMFASTGGPIPVDYSSPCGAGAGYFGVGGPTGEDCGSGGMIYSVAAQAGGPQVVTAAAPGCAEGYVRSGLGCAWPTGSGTTKFASKAAFPWGSGPTPENCTVAPRFWGTDWNCS